MKTFSIAALLQRTEPTQGGCKTISRIVLGHRVGSIDEAIGKFVMDMLESDPSMSIAQVVCTQVPSAPVIKGTDFS